MRHPADEFREKRAKYFAIANSHNFDKAFYILEKDRDNGTMDSKDYAGLLGELIFLKSYQSEMDLIPTLDCGDHCDFSGVYNSKMARFDVTTSLEYKNLDEYEKFQQKGKSYYIALIDYPARKVDRIVDINIPFCPACGGRLINTLILEDVKYTENGTPTQTEQLIKVCSNNTAHNIEHASFEYFTQTITTETAHLYESADITGEDVGEKIKSLPRILGINSSVFFTKIAQEKIHACAQEIYTQIGRDGDGYWEKKLFWTTDLVDKIFPMNFDENI